MAKYSEICETIKTKRFTLRAAFNSRAINGSLNNPKKLWSSLNRIIYNKNGTTKTISSLSRDDGTLLTNKTAIANKFNTFFKDVGKSLYEQISSNSIQHSREIETQINPSSMFLFDTNDDEVFAKIKSIKNSFTLKDYISSNLCKNSARELSPILSKLINNCFANGRFPDQLKLSRIIPIYKEGDPMLATNYRPISILPVLSKVCESLLCDRLNNFIIRNKIINANQFGFQKNSGTLSAAASFIDILQSKLDEKNNLACCVFIDLRKAFDTVPHGLLLDKLKNYGMRGNINTLLNDYLANRKQYVDLNDGKSDILINDNRFSLPQGSNLGPLLFILYINGILDLKLNGKLSLFADDAELTYFDTNLNTLQTKIQEDLNAIAKWLTSNKLTLNTHKTKFMLVKTGAPADPMNNQFNLTINGNHISRVSSFKYLGITLQENMKWDIHIDSLCQKMYGIASIAKRLGGRIHESTKISLYYAMVNSHLMYMSPVWSTSLLQQDLNRLQVAQNQTIRSIFYHEYNALDMDTAQIRQKYKIMNVRQLLLYNEILTIFKIKKGLLKSNYRIDLTRTHNYQTRATPRPRAPVPRTNIGAHSIFRKCTEKYFSLNFNLIDSQNIFAFKKSIKKA